VPDAVSVRRIFATDADRVRAIRLEALQDAAAGIAFLESYSDAVEKPSEFWTDRAVSGALGDGVGQFVAEEHGRWIGTVTVLLPVAGSTDYFGRTHVDGRALLVSVYVAPAHRGGAVLAALVDAASAWTQTHARTELSLDVHEDNARAQAAYRKLGFATTGATSVGPNGTELEMVRRIGQNGAG
jgi:Acetyltransferases